jgi:sugar/nucleoside kinase (ribokinase family)
VGALPRDLAWADFFGAPKAPRRALLGFDGFVDSLYRVIRDHTGGSKNAFPAIPDFARDLLGRAGRSGGFELSFLGARAGGNAPLMAAGLSALGVSTACVGALGAPPSIDPIFAPLAAAGCELHSVAPPARTMALEFDDGKLMFNDSRSFDGLDWPCVASAAGEEGLASLASGSDLIALLGWANMPRATDLWRGLLERALEGGAGPASPKKVFVDLADISRAGAAEISELAALLRRYRKHAELALGLNENEARKLAGLLGLDAAQGGLEALGGRLHEALSLDLVLIHPRRGAVVADSSGARTLPGELVEKPLLSTGGGDHFNAAFCYGWLHGLPPERAAGLAVLASGHYVKTGRSARLEDLQALCGASKGMHAA